MKVCGIIAEYDPFHRGHLYHLDQAREKSGADYLVCVLGGAFSQRGDAMLFSTRDRAKMALDNGFDLVVGLPVSFSCAQANRFAAGGVGILHSLGVVSHLSFGCESDDIRHLWDTALLLNRPDEGFALNLKAELARGASFARAQGMSLQKALPAIPADLFAAPNFILGVSYLRELDRLGSPIKPVPVLRTSPYHGRAAGPLASASAVRAMLQAGKTEGLAETCPEASVRLIQEAVTHPPAALDKALLAALLAKPSQSFHGLMEVSEGLEQRLLAAARQAVSREGLIALAKTKRYPHARISRALSQALLGLDMSETRPAYARLLGLRERARPLVKAIAAGGFPLITRPARSQFQGLLQDMRAEELWYIGSGQAARTAWQQEVIVL